LDPADALGGDERSTPVGYPPLPPANQPTATVIIAEFDFSGARVWFR